MKVIWLPRAIATRDTQLDYIIRANPHAAIEQGDHIAHQVNQLAQHPEIGREGRKQGARELVISHTPFLVVYRIRLRAKRIEVLRVLHTSQQWP